MSNNEQKGESPLVVCISGAAGQIAYSLIPLVASGRVFGATQHVVLHLFDIPPMQQKMEGVAMEITDCGYTLVDNVVICTDAESAFKGVNYAILLGGFPRGPGMLRSDLLAKNSPIFVSQGQALNAHAAAGVKVLVVANPANTNCLVLAKNAPDLPRTSFSALTKLDLHRANGQLAAKAGVPVSQVDGVAIFGNHSKTMYPDISKATIGGKPVSEVIDAEWLKETFISTVQQRGAAVIKARGLSSATSAANAAADHMKCWHQGTEPGQHTSMAVYSTGEYGIAKDIIFSYPVTITNGEYTIVPGFEFNDDAKARIKATETELLEEKTDAKLE